MYNASMKWVKIRKLILLPIISGAMLLSSIPILTGCNPTSAIVEQSQEEDIKPEQQEIKFEPRLWFNSKRMNNHYLEGEVVTIGADLFPQGVFDVNYAWDTEGIDTKVNTVTPNCISFVAQLSDNGRKISATGINNDEIVQASGCILVSPKKNDEWDTALLVRQIADDEKNLCIWFSNKDINRNYYVEGDWIQIGAKMFPAQKDEVTYIWEIIDSDTNVIKTNISNNECFARFQAKACDNGKWVKLSALHNDMVYVEYLLLSIRSQDRTINQLYDVRLSEDISNLTSRMVSHENAKNLEAFCDKIDNSFYQTIDTYKIQKYLAQWVFSFIDNYTKERDQTCKGYLTNIDVRWNDTTHKINGIIEIDFDWQKDMSATAQELKRKKNDSEKFTFTFNESPIKSYVNYAYNSFISFKIDVYKTKHLVLKNNGIGNKAIEYNNEKILLDCNNDICIDLTNSPFTIDFDTFYENMHSNSISEYVSRLNRELISAIASQSYWFKFAGNHPITGQELTKPIFTVKTNYDYRLLQSYEREAITNDLTPILHFIDDKNQLHITEDYVFIECSNIELDRIVSIVSTTTNQVQSRVRQLNNKNNILLQAEIIKDHIILHNKDWIGQSWLGTLSLLDPIDRIKAIYTFILGHVEYDFNECESLDSIIGYVDQILSSKGIAKIFNYFASMLNVKSIFIRGISDSTVDQHLENFNANNMHAWNLVYIGDDKWAWCDPTWDIIIGNQQSFRYFLNDTKTFFLDHGHVCVTNWAEGNLLPNGSYVIHL